MKRTVLEPHLPTLQMCVLKVNLCAEIGIFVFTKLGPVMVIRTVLTELMKMRRCAAGNPSVQRMISAVPMDSVSRDISNVLVELTARIIVMSRIVVRILHMSLMIIFIMFRNTRTKV